MRTLAFLLLLTLPAAAHEWYAPHCCSEMDCRPVPCDELSEGGGGSVDYTPLDKYFEKSKVYPSQDARCHVCLHGGDKAPICAYVQMGF